MADKGHEETEKLLRKLEKELAEEYKKARYEILEKYAEHCNRFAKREAEMAELVRQGLVTEEAFNEWKMKEIPVNARWNEMCDTIARDCTMTNQMAKSIAYGYMPEIYAINYNYGTYQVESVCGIDTGFPYLYDRSTVERLFRGGEFIHAPGQKITDKINMKKDLAWNKKQVRSVLFQGIVQGESIPKMVKRLRKTVGDSITEDDIKNKNMKDAKQIAREVERRNRNAAIRNVRTMATGVQNAGRVDSYKRAQGMGIDLQQEWLATLDGRTRHQHRLLDGQRVDVGEKFKVDGDEIEYPGDPSAKGYLVYNCRCTLVPALKGFGVDANNLSLRNTDHLPEGMTYEQWRVDKYPKPPKKPVAAAQNSGYTKVRTRKEAETQLQTMFGKVSKDTKDFDEKLLVDNVNQLSKLEKKFGVLGGIGNTEFDTRKGSYIGKATGFTQKGKMVKAKITLNKEDFKSYKDMITNEARRQKIVNGKSWHMPCNPDEFGIYTATHEYGHILTYSILDKRGAWSSNSARIKEYDNMYNEIVNIAKKNNPGFDITKNLSEYGMKKKAEFMAEVFANSQLSKPNELGLAMQEWLKKEGF